MKSARSLFIAKEYEKSIAELNAAYELMKWPICLYNIAQSLRRMGRRVEARDHYRRFLVDAPSSRFAADAQQAITEIELFLEQQAQLEREKKKPVWKKGWFWGVLGGSVALVAAGVTTGLVLGLRSGMMPSGGPAVIVLR